MKNYLDTSVALRRLLLQPGALPFGQAPRELFSSILLRTEMLRAVDRLRLEGALDDIRRAQAIRQVDEWCASVSLIPLSDPIVTRAGDSFPTVVGTLDALHLATALALRDRGVAPLTFLTHDRQQSLAARSLGFAVVGIDP